MRADPRYWKGYYSDDATLALDLQYSLSDRIRYYWNVPAVRSACDALVADLRRRRIPLTLMSQYLPRQYAAVRSAGLPMIRMSCSWRAYAPVLRGYARAWRGL